MATVFRGMKDDGEGQPACGPSARMLGVRLEGDIPIDDQGAVAPLTGGMSVAIDEIANLPEHRRPEEHGGYGPDPVWRIDTDDLTDSLSFRPDPRDPSRHGFVEPIEAMSLDEFQQALAATRGFWSKA